MSPYLTKTIVQAEKGSQVGSEKVIIVLYIAKQKNLFFWMLSCYCNNCKPKY